MNRRKFLYFGIVTSSLITIFLALIASAFVFKPDFSILTETEYRAHIQNENIYVGTYTDYDASMLEYRYVVPKDSNGNFLIDPEKPEDYLLKFINSQYLIVTFKDDGMHSETLQKHKLDQFVFLNNQTNTAEVLYNCYGQDRILYGNEEIVIIYNSKSNSVQYISLEDKKVFKEVALNLNKLGYYTIWVKESENSIVIEQHPVFSYDTKIVAELKIQKTGDGSLC